MRTHWLLCFSLITGCGAASTGFDSTNSQSDAGRDGGSEAGDDGGQSSDAFEDDAGASAVDAGVDAGGADPDAGSSSGLTCTPPTASFLPLPTDTSLRGPWDVGAQTTTIAGLRAEVWYPAAPGSAAQAARRSYDVREHLPPADRIKISDADNPLQVCDCFGELPIDAVHGPYPVVVFAHGTAAFRTQSLTMMTHWASRGFVVIAADHPGLELKDVLMNNFGGDTAGDLRQILAALPTLASFSPHLDLTRVGLSGHSAGGGAIASLGLAAGIGVMMPLAAQGVGNKASGVRVLIMGGKDDGIARYSGQSQGYASTASPKRLVGLASAGHLAFSDLCIIGRDQGGLLAIAQRSGVVVNPLIALLARDGCAADDLNPERGLEIIKDATAAALEEGLLCRPERADALRDLARRYPEVDYTEAL